MLFPTTFNVTAQTLVAAAVTLTSPSIDRMPTVAVKPAPLVVAAPLCQTAEGAFVTAARWNELHSLLHKWSGLAPDWDGEGGRSPSSSVVTSVFDFLLDAQVASVPLPKAFVGGDGEIEYQWEKGGAFASVSFLDDGNIVALVRGLPAGAPPLRIDEPYSDLVDQAGLFRRLTAFA